MSHAAAKNRRAAERAEIRQALAHMGITAPTRDVVQAAVEIRHSLARGAHVAPFPSALPIVRPLAAQLPPVLA